MDDMRKIDGQSGSKSKPPYLGKPAPFEDGYNGDPYCMRPHFKHLVERLDAISGHTGQRLSVRDFFQYIRYRHLEAILGEDRPFAVKESARSEIISLEEGNSWLKNSACTDELNCLAAEIALEHGIRKVPALWSSFKFHMTYRIRKIDELRNALGDGELACINSETIIENAKKAVADTYDLSLLPYNLVKPANVVSKFIPKLPEMYSGKLPYSIDPYGIFEDFVQVKALVEISEQEVENCKKDGTYVHKDGKHYRKEYLGSRKFDYAVLLNVTENCPVGCAACYKKELTRMDSDDLGEIRRQLTHDGGRAAGQAELLVRWLDKHPEVNTVIISGGEPLLFHLEDIRKMMDVLGKAKHLKTVRICTSAVFQGLSYFITDEFAQMLADFRYRTGKEVHLNTHVTDESQLLAPEARIAVETLRMHGISVHLQMPIQEGINFWREDVERTAEKLAAILRAAHDMDVVPYKFIVDMHSPSHHALTVPIEVLSKALGLLESHMKSSDEERGQAWNVLLPQGNLYIYPWPHFCAVKEVDSEAGVVRYFMAKRLKVSEGGRIAVYIYEEPQLPGLNDDQDSLPKPVDADVLVRMDEVRKAYGEFREKIAHTTDQVQKEHLKMELYEVCGIPFARNEPLVVGQES